MGYTTDSRGIENFWPDDTDSKLYIFGDASIGELIELIHDKFGADTSLDDVTLSAENIHVYCLRYDLHDPADWAQFLVIEKNTDN